MRRFESCRGHRSPDSVINPLTRQRAKYEGSDPVSLGPTLRRCVSLIASEWRVVFRGPPPTPAQRPSHTASPSEQRLAKGGRTGVQYPELSRVQLAAGPAGLLGGQGLPTARSQCTPPPVRRHPHPGPWTARSSDRSAGHGRRSPDRRCTTSGESHGRWAGGESVLQQRVGTGFLPYPPVVDGAGCSVALVGEGPAVLGRPPLPEALRFGGPADSLTRHDAGSDGLLSDTGRGRRLLG